MSVKYTRPDHQAWLSGHRIALCHNEFVPAAIGGPRDGTANQHLSGAQQHPLNLRGEIEPFTDDQAEHVRNLLCDARREQLAMPRLEAPWPRRSPLAHHLDRHQHRQLPSTGHRSRERLPPRCLVHGFVEEGRPNILIGGAAPDPLKRVLRAVIAYAVAGTGLRVEIVATDEPLGGAD